MYIRRYYFTYFTIDDESSASLESEKHERLVVLLHTYVVTRCIVNYIYIPESLIHCVQSLAVIVEKGLRTSSSGSSHDSASLSTCLKTHFTLEKASSIGFRYGEYDGRKSSKAPTSSIIVLMP